MKIPIKNISIFLKRYGIFCVVAFAAGLRFLNLGWDSYTFDLHSDELFISQYAQGIHFFTNLNPNFWGYHGALFYILKLTGMAFAFVTGNPWWSQTTSGLTFAGRYLSAFLSTAAVFILFSAAKHIAGKKAGLVTAILAAASVFLIQTAHFHVTENYMLFFESLLILSTLAYFRKGTVRSLFAIAVWFALGVATTKNTSLLFVIIPLCAVLARRMDVAEKIKHLIFFGVISTACLFLATPYTFLHAGEFLAYSKRLAGDVSGTLLYSWSLQFKGTDIRFWIPTVFFIFNPFIVFGVIASCVIGINQFVKRKRFDGYSGSVVFAVLYAAYIGFAYIKFVRYLMPLVPILYISSGVFFARLWDRYPNIGKWITVLAIGASIMWGCLFSTIYLKQHPSVEASRWMIGTIKPNAIILRELGNTFLPLTSFPQPFETVDFDFYATDTEEKMTELSGILAGADYMTVSSRRVYQTVMRLSEYPLTSRYYRKLFDGQLGYELAGDYSSYPTIDPFVVNDDMTEETFAVFDHPHVRIYRNTGKFTQKRLEELLIY